MDRPFTGSHGHAGRGGGCGPERPRDERRVDVPGSLDERASPGGVRLTDTQFATLETALESGYYRVPREQTIEELATELDVSHQALSERLRRGHRTLVETVLEL
ncbi:hypothetical protein BRC67_09015 [Halobacteriales archaeon QH_3_68_24]|nr:MAG: hypothetical protein BRC67_09015 [Halobacteriales archaeon QH_3_68_24]